MSDEPRSVTWKATLIGAAMTLATSAGGYISSHWSGVTADQLKESEGRIGAKIDKVDLKVSRSSDDLKVYVDEKIASAEERARPKKKKRSNAEP